ncbi:MAG: hypothetical protein CL472_06405 [Acidobacteria bacterium]|nr:hypothetical protein [Acidobacteriota bacterium]|tara:strand:- start:193 stop:453 length:261 start_codon:yes stop_codon:yes gene_type:complete
MKFRPQITVTMTPNEIALGTTTEGRPYASCKSAKIERPGRSDCNRTVMAFGPIADEIGKLTPGTPVPVTVQHQGAILRVVKLPAAA